ncbi:MAG: NfeD family protein [Pseudomonadota bacterium]
MLPAAVTFWHWWILGVLLVVIEVFAPGFVFFWLGLGAVATGLVLLVTGPFDWQFQLLVFAGFAVLSVLAWLLVGRRWLGEGKPTELNRRANQLEGHVFVLSDPIENGRGRVKVGDGSWVVTGDDLPAGSKVRVVGSEGNTLRVESA